jgi:hypothetical protein
MWPRLQTARGARFRFASYLKRSEVVPACKQGSLCTGRQTLDFFRPEHIAHGLKRRTDHTADHFDGVLPLFLC